MYLDIPNLQSVDLPDSFKRVLIPSLKSTYYACRLFLDVHHLLAAYFPITTYSYGFIQSIDFTVTSIIIPNWTCNERDYQVFDVSRFSLVESIEIGDDCFGSVKTFKIEGLNRLKMIKIGINSFTQKKHSEGNNESKSFYVLNCELLESIQIGENSFSDFAGEFELKNLPQLQSIQIGIVGSSSSNFYWSSLVIGGIELILSI